MEFIGFNKIARLSREMIISEKLDGCFDYKSRILTDKGYIPIGKIVNQKLNYKVMSYNFDKQQFEMTDILNWFKKDSNYKEFLHIKLRGFKQGTAYHSFRCTPNHLILTKNGYVRADKLTLADKVCSPDNPLTFIQKQMILGTLLGDASIGKADSNSLSYRHSQSIKHGIYSKLVRKLLGRFYISTRILRGGYANTDITIINSNFDIQLQEYLNQLYVEEKKSFSENILKTLSPIALAFWYMDDGSCMFTNTQKPRLNLHTQGFNEKQIDILINMLNIKFNLFPKKFNYGKGFQLTFNTHDTDIFLNLVAPYISKDLQYKLPINYRTTFCYWDNYKENVSSFYEQEIISLKANKSTGQEYHYKYDIETKNHNYIVSGVVVHNSNAQVLIVPKSDIPESEYWKSELIVGDFIIRAGSRTRFIQPGNDNFGFAKWVHENAEELIKLGKGKHFGEWIGRGIQRGYGLNEKRFYLFNVSKWANQNASLVDGQGYCPKCCEVVPVLYQGMFDTQKINEVLEDLKINGSRAVPGYFDVEGIVIFHTASGHYYKKTIEKDEKPKSLESSV